MNVELLIIFIALNAVNVVIQTIKSLCTIKGGKMVAASANAIAYGLYTVVVVMTMCDLPILHKALVVAFCNFIGVWIVKFIEEKMRKDKLWQLSITVNQKDISNLHEDYEMAKLSHNYIDIGKWGVFTIYCESQQETTKATDIAKKYGAKMFATENKLAL